MKILFCGDWHYRGTNPRARVDDYRETLKGKLQQVFQLAKSYGVRFIVTPGDTFDRPDVSVAMVLDLARFLWHEAPVPIITTAGNHDLFGHNPESYGRTSLAIIAAIMRQDRFRVIMHPSGEAEAGAFREIVGRGNDRRIYRFSAIPFSPQVDRGGFGYCPGAPAIDGETLVHISHGMLMDHVPPWDKFTLVDDVKTEADIVLAGHDHLGFGVIKRRDGKIFVNPGGLIRISASVAEMNRPIRVAVIDLDTKEVKLVPLNVQPGDRVLDRTSLEHQAAISETMRGFTEVLDQSTELRLLDLTEIIERLTKAESLPDHVRDEALARLAKVRERLKV